MKIKYLPIIINPASGKCEPILPIINRVFKDSDVKWDSLIAKKEGDARGFAEELLKKKVEAIGVYGGDGTIMEVMDGMMGSEVPLAVMPGGTGNVLATDLGIPKDLEEVCTMIAKGRFKLQAVDVGQFNKKHFIVRASLGFEANMVKNADRGVKNRWGRFAYTVGAFKALKKVKMVNYDVTVDGEKHDVSGMSCIVANSGNTGYGDLQLAQKMDVTDGLLDVLVLKKFDFSLVKYIYRILIKGDPEKDRELVAHWQGKDIRIKSSPVQELSVDGEMVKKMEFHAKVIPGAVQILVPRQSREN